MSRRYGPPLYGKQFCGNTSPDNFEIPGLGKIKRLTDLSQKRVTKAAREKLRSVYG